jgi:hypothetical protein
MQTQRHYDEFDAENTSWLLAAAAASRTIIDAASAQPALNQGIPDIRQKPSESVLAAYVAGWSEADPRMIASATAEGYEFHDPLVGRF